MGFFPAIIFAQLNGKKFALSANLVYTTSAEIFLNPNSSDVLIRNKSFELSDIINPGVDFRYFLSRDILLGLNVEYINKTGNAPNLNAFVGNQVVTIFVEDGFKVIPIELSAYYYLPFSSEQFIFMMGGGVGYYRGEFTRKIEDVELSLVRRQIAVGIHVTTSMDYLFSENFSMRFEMKFRNPQYNVETKYTKTEVIYQGSVIELPQNTFETKVDVNGVTFQLGLVYFF